MDTLAVAGLCGVPVARIVYGEPVERELWLRVTRRASEVKVLQMKNQAVYTANAIGNMYRRRG